MLLDVEVAPGAPPPNAQVLKKRVHSLLGKALRGLPEDSRLAVESGTTAVVCFVGDPEDGLDAALVLRDQVAQYYKGKLSVRVALDLGTVEIALDPKDQFHVTGDAVRQAARVKEQAQANQVLVSHSYHKLLSHINPNRSGGFVPLAAQTGTSTVYAAPPSAGTEPPRPAPPRVITRPAPLMGDSPIGAEAVQEIERQLARRIGPMAGVLVRKIERRVSTALELRQTLAAALPEPQGLRLFPVDAPTGPGPASASEPDLSRQVDITPSELALIEHTLRRFIGPMAQPLMHREIERCRQFKDFVAAIAGGIDHSQQREVFLQALQRALPERLI